MGRTGVLSSAVLACLWFCPPAAAQTPPQTPAQTFAALQQVLKPRQRVIVIDNAGKKLSGRVASIAGQLQLDFGRKQQKTYSEDGVRKIENDDTNWDGFFIGYGAGMALGAAIVRHESPHSEGEELVLGILVMIAGGPIGEWLDGHRHRVLFVSPKRTTTSLIPILGRYRAGLALKVRF